jgi:glycerophosphoryl diester phosphodiesterase
MPAEILNIAHRGASAWSPENTIVAFETALQMGADGFELDVQLSKDDQLVVIHDGSVNRTTGASGRVAAMTLAELKRLDAGTWFNRHRPRRAQPHYAGERIPLLSEALDLAKQTSSLVYIELKFTRDSRDGLVDRVITLVKDLNISQQVIIESFVHDAIKLVKERSPELRTAALFGRSISSPGLSIKRMLRVVEDSGADEIALEKALATNRVLAAASAAKLPVAVWTVNSKRYMLRASELGLKAIITNYPDRMCIGSTASRQKE